MERTVITESVNLILGPSREVIPGIVAYVFLLLLKVVGVKVLIDEHGN